MLRFDSECKRWNPEHVVLDPFSYVTPSALLLSLSSLVGQLSVVPWFRRSVCCSLCPQFFDHVTFLWARSHASGAGLVRDFRAANWSRPGSASASPLGSTSTAVCCASSTSNSSPKMNGRGSFFAACSSHGSSRRLARATGRARLTLQESVNFCSCASSTCAIASKSHRIASGTWTR